MKKCNFEQNTIKVPQGNAWQLLLPLSTAKWRGQDLVTESIDYRALEDIAVFIDGDEWDYTLQENGILCDIPADMPLGPHNTVITATYFGVEVKAAYFQNFTIMEWSFESNVGEHLLDAPLVSDAAYIYVGITDDAELEALKQQYRDATAACETARLQYEAAKEEFDEKAEQLDDVAQQTTLLQKSAAIIEAISGIHIDIPDNIATKDDVTAAKQAILDALSHIAPEDPNSKALAEFFGVTLLQGYEFMTDTEVTDELEDIMQALDPELEQEVEYPEGSGTYMTKAQAITAEAMQIINPSQS